jgi:hypothetical protein
VLRSRLAIASSIVALGVGVAAAAGIVSKPGSAAAAPSATATAADYPALVDALTQGYDVEITTQLDKCTSPDGKTPGPVDASGLHIQAYMIPNDQYVAFSDVHQMLSPQNTPVTEYIVYTVKPDNSVTLAATTLGANNTVTSTVDFDCRIGNGAQFHWTTY